MAITNIDAEVIDSNNGILKLTSILLNLYLQNRARDPKTKRIFAILLPITFDIAISVCPIEEEQREVANSGKEVPSDTSKKPTKKPLTFNFLERAVAWSTKTSAIFTTKISDTTISIRLIILDSIY